MYSNATIPNNTDQPASSSNLLYNARGMHKQLGDLLPLRPPAALAPFTAKVPPKGPYSYSLSMNQKTQGVLAASILD